MNNEDFAKEIRKLTLELIFQSKSSHIGGAFSMCELIAVLYNSVANIDSKNPLSPGRDRVFLSKGHACSSLYAALALKGFFPREELLKQYAKNGSIFTSHASHHVAGVELSTGSLGHALSFAVGSALAARVKKQNWKSYVILSDGELNEGSNWEAIMLAGQHKLNNLVVLIDANKIQSLGNTKDVIDLSSLDIKLNSFGWKALEIDGHDVNQIEKTLLSHNYEKPLAIVANTIKGKGVSFMENELLWHYKSPDEDEYIKAMEELS